VTFTLEGNRALLDGFRRGDRHALAETYRGYVQDLARTVRQGIAVDVDGQRVRVGANPPESEVELVLQETFVRAFSASARAAYDGVRPFGAYLATIARNIVIDRARAARTDARLVPIDDDHGELPADPSSPDPLWNIEERELTRLVAAAVATLDERHRKIFALRYEQGLDQGEVAARLGIAKITVRRIDVQIRHHILEHLRREGHLQDTAVGIPRLARDRSSG
jgi:RNA polymerase sigma-70 factor (ECF subfamily)